MHFRANYRCPINHEPTIHGKPLVYYGHALAYDVTGVILHNGRGSETEKRHPAAGFRDVVHTSGRISGTTATGNSSDTWWPRASEPCRSGKARRRIPAARPATVYVGRRPWSLLDACRRSCWSAAQPGDDGRAQSSEPAVGGPRLLTSTTGTLRVYPDLRRRRLWLSEHSSSRGRRRAIPAAGVKG